MRLSAFVQPQGGLGHGEQTDFSLITQAFRIGLVERDVLAAAAERDGVVAMVADALR